MRRLFYSCFLLTLALLPMKAGAFGITPATVMNDRLLPGSVLEKTVTISRTDAEKSMEINTAIRPAKLTQWITISPQQIHFLPGEKKKDLTITIEIPKGQTDGVYAGNIDFSEAKTSSSGVPGTVALTGASLSISLQVVSKKMSEFSVLSVGDYQIKPQKKIWRWSIPGVLYLPVVIRNSGNTPIAPQKMQIDFLKHGVVDPKERILVYNIGLVDAFETRTIAPSVRYSLPAGEYDVVLRIFDGYTLAAGGERDIRITVPEQEYISSPMRYLFQRIVYNIRNASLW